MKPGSEEVKRLAAMSKQAADIRTAVPPATAALLQAEAEKRLGMRCGGCGERITLGFKFTKLAVIDRNGTPEVEVSRLSACNGDSGCDWAREAKADATVIEMIEFAWFDEPGEDEDKPPTAE